MKLLKMNFREENVTESLAEKLYPYYNNSVVIVNIGTDRCIGDALAPIVGTMLKESNLKIPVYGTIKEPIHALNLERRLSEIKVKHPNAFIIGIDACLGDKDNIGEIQLRDYPISPGKGVGKTLPQVGDLSIAGIVDDADNNQLFTNRNIRLDLIYDMAKIISNAILEVENRYYINNGEVAVSNF